MIRQFTLKQFTVRCMGLALAGGLLASWSAAQSTAAKPAPSATPTAYGYRTHKLSRRASVYYGLLWGVDTLSVKSMESGELIRFSYRVLDADRAKALNDKKVEPVLIDPEANVKLVIPSLEKVGQLRQSASPVAGKQYWMAFSNKGRPVKPGHRVTVVIGRFRAEGLMVE